MPTIWLVVSLFVLSAIGFFVGRNRALQSAGGDTRDLHSLPIYYGMNVALTALIPALSVLVIWVLAQPMIIDTQVSRTIPAELIPESSTRGLVMSDVRRVADGLDLAVSLGGMTEADSRAINAETTDVRARLGEYGVALGSDVRPEVLKAAQTYRNLTATASLAMNVVVAVLAIGGLVLAYSKTHKDFRARNVVERGVLALLIFAASLAILTTVGIVLSMLFETLNFFSLHDWKDFFLGTTWAPNFRGDSELSILPLLWGTLYISFIALLVAVPVGLFAAVYLSEYASGATRAFAKPLLEILAGIPTIVYGLFALLTVGPMLVRVFGRGDNGLLGVEWMAGATSVLTAGIVMGIMLIPFVSSLSDDIILSLIHI